MTKIEIESSVDNGVKFFNENVPNWANQIDLDILDINKSCNCVLGQLKLWGQGPKYSQNFDTSDVAISMGLLTPFNHDWVTYGKVLTNEWKRRILELRAINA